MTTNQTFCSALPRAVAEELGDRAATHHLVTSHMVKLWFGNKALHYECGVYAHRKVIEIGLHFESDAMTNLRLLGAFRARSSVIARRLPTARIEPWDKGWVRVWESIPLAPLAPFAPTFRERVAKRLAGYISVLEPIL